MKILEIAWAWAQPRLFNLYSIRALIVGLLAIAAPALPPQLVHELQSIADAAGAGDKTKLILAIFGGAYVLLDIVRKSKGPAVAAGVGKG